MGCSASTNQGVSPEGLPPARGEEERGTPQRLLGNQSSVRQQSVTLKAPGGGKGLPGFGTVEKIQSADQDQRDWHLECNLTEHQKQLRSQLRERLEDLGVLVPGFSDDTVLLRFLKSTWNVETAVSKYKKMVLWRKEMQIDNLLETFDFPELHEILQHQSIFYHKQDKFGRPVCVMQYGHFDASKVRSLTSVDRFYKWYYWGNEHYERFVVPAVSNLVGKPVFECVNILDLKGYSLKNMTSDTKRAFGVVSETSEEYYPEQMGLTLVVNTPKMFRIIWNIVEKVVSDRTRKKVFVLGDDYQDVLRAIIPEENLLEVYGGKSKMPDNYRSVGAWMDVEPCRSASYYPVGNIHTPTRYDANEQ